MRSQREAIGFAHRPHIAFNLDFIYFFKSPVGLDSACFCWQRSAACPENRPAQDDTSLALAAALPAIPNQPLEAARQEPSFPRLAHPKF